MGAAAGQFSSSAFAPLEQPLCLFEGSKTDIRMESTLKNLYFNFLIFFFFKFFFAI
jgi:hypothetical protein